MKRLILACTVLCAASAALAQAPYPWKPIRLMSAAAPGTPADVVTRILAEPLGKALGQPVVVENRPGAINTIGLAAVARSEPDGHNLGVLGLPSTVAPSLLAAMPYDTLRDFAPVRQLSWVSNVLVVRGDSPYLSVSDVVAQARARPGRVPFASGGNGTPAHLAGELFAQQAGIALQHVPYKGAVAGVSAVLSSQVEFMFAVAPSVIPHLKSGRLRALATPAPSRLAALPDVPTLQEAGYAVEIRDWHGVVAPAGTPKAVIARLEAAFAQVLGQADVKERLARVGLEPAESSADAFGSHIRSELRKWARVVSNAGMKPD